MPKILSITEIKEIIQANPIEQLFKDIENGFISYSQQKVTVPPVSHLGFNDPPADVHIKSGYIVNDSCFVVKIASGFYNNPALGLNSSNGLMLVFNRETGALLAILLDEGHLTDLRTAIAGAIAAKHLAPRNVTHIGIVGTGIQARLQLQLLKHVIACRDVIVFGRDKDKLELYKNDASLYEFNISTTTNIEEVTGRCNLIVTTTPSDKPILFKDMIKPGTHITAVGADAAGKQELDSSLFSKAGIVVADSISQCLDHGELYHAKTANAIDVHKIIELGELIQHPVYRNPEDITIADLTGVAVQDIQIAKFVYSRS